MTDDFVMTNRCHLIDPELHQYDIHTNCEQVSGVSNSSVTEEVLNEREVGRTAPDVSKDGINYDC